LKAHQKFICAQHIEEETEEENDNEEVTNIPIEDEGAEKERKRNINQPTEAEREEQTAETEKGKEREEEEVAKKEEKAKESTQQQRKPQTKHRKYKINETEMAHGYMNSHGKPRQPKETQMNQAMTLLYDKETKTWQCLKCEKKYMKQNARSARSHATAHKKKEEKERIDKGKTLLRTCSQQNQDEVRLRTLRHYGNEYRGITQPQQENTRQENTGTQTTNKHSAGKKKGETIDENEREMETQQKKRSENKEIEHNRPRNEEEAKPTETTQENQKPTREQGDNKEKSGRRKK